MDLGIFSLIRTLTSNSITLVDKLGSAAVLTTTAVETTARTLNHAAEMAEVAVVATKEEMQVEFKETLAIMKVEADKRLKVANSQASNTSSTSKSTTS